MPGWSVRHGLAAALMLALAGCGGNGGGVRPTDLPTVGESACRAEVAASTNSGSVRILNSSGNTVTIRAPGGNWTCQLNSSGQVIGVRRS
jgi:hypothetical protein